MYIFQDKLRKLFVVVCSLWIISVCLVPSVQAESLTPPTVPLKVAFIGDVGVRSTSEQVMTLIKNEGAQLIVIVGDFDYLDDPARFFNMVYNKSGGTIPILVVIGNHDVGKWNGSTGYQARFYSKLGEFPEVNCSGDFGINGSCTYKGVKFLLSGVAVAGNNHDQYLTSQLSASPNLWNVCVWHITHEKFQVGGKTDNRHLNSYEVCRQAGAVIMTAHEHSYQRTKTLTNMGTRSVSPEWPSSNNLAVGPGLSFVTVSGAGGESLRPQTRCLPATPPYGCNEWANIYTTNQGAKFGATFITFGDGGPNKATGYFKNIAGEIKDQYTITNTKSNTPTPLPTAPASPSPTPTSTPIPTPTATPDPHRGDFNLDGSVNMVDFNSLLTVLHTNNPLHELTGSDNDYIDLYDYNEFLKIIR